MAPAGTQLRVSRLWEGTGFPLRRDASGASASTVSPSVYLGIGIGVGGAILLAVILVAVQIVKKRKEHKRLLEALEVEQAVQVARLQNIADIPRPASVARCSTLVPLHAHAVWGVLSSDETLHDPSIAQANKKNLTSVSLPKRIKQRGIPLKRLKRLTAIIESPRSRKTASPVVQFPDPLPSECAVEQVGSSTPSSKEYTLRRVDPEDVLPVLGVQRLRFCPLLRLGLLEDMAQASQTTIT